MRGVYDNFNSVATFIENPFHKIPFSYVPEGATEAEIRNDILFSYFVFYLDLKKLRRMFAKPEEGVGWFNAGAKLTELLKKIPALLLLGGGLCLKFGELFINILLKRNTYITMQECIKLLVKQ